MIKNAGPSDTGGDKQMQNGRKSMQISNLLLGVISVPRGNFKT